MKPSRSIGLVKSEQIVDGHDGHDGQYDISIHVFGWRREKSLRRLCNSLLKAKYHGHQVPLFFHIDGDPLDLVVEYVQAFSWPHGPKHVEVREQRLGLPRAILSGWIPRSPEEYAVLLEDDVEVATGFFEWTIYCLSFINQRRIVDGEGHGLMGCSFYTPRVDEIGPAPNAWSPPPWDPAQVVGKGSRLFYFQLPCSWGVVYYAKYWIDFLKYHAIRERMPSFPPTPGSRSNEWFSSWKRILIELMLMRGWYLLYPSFAHRASFSTNHFELGIHSVPEGVSPTVNNELRKGGDPRFAVPLVQERDYRGALPPVTATSVPWVNLYHRLVTARSELFCDRAVFPGKIESPELENFLSGMQL